MWRCTPEHMFLLEVSVHHSLWHLLAVLHKLRPVRVHMFALMQDLVKQDSMRFGKRVVPADARNGSNRVVQIGAEVIRAAVSQKPAILLRNLSTRYVQDAEPVGHQTLLRWVFCRIGFVAPDVLHEHPCPPLFL